MTNDKVKMANALLGDAKKSFNKLFAIKDIEVVCELVTEAAFVTKADGKEESLFENFTNGTTFINAMPVDGTAKRTCKRYTIDSLFGLPRAIVLAIYQSCKLNNQ